MIRWFNSRWNTLKSPLDCLSVCSWDFWSTFRFFKNVKKRRNFSLVVLRSWGLHFACLNCKEEIISLSTKYATQFRSSKIADGPKVSDPKCDKQLVALCNSVLTHTQTRFLMTCYYIFVIRVGYILITITYCQRWPLSHRMVTIENDLLLEVGNHQVLPIFRWTNLHMLQKKKHHCWPKISIVPSSVTIVNWCEWHWSVKNHQFSWLHHVTSSVLNSKIPLKSYKIPYSIQYSYKIP